MEFFDENQNIGETEREHPLTDPAPEGGKDAEIRPEDYPNRRRYDAACMLRLYEQEGCDFIEDIEDIDGDFIKDCCEFILNSADSILAANYLTYDGDFLFALAIRDHFGTRGLLRRLASDGDYADCSLDEIVAMLAKYDPPMSLDVWRWCVEEFMPYTDYSLRGAYELSDDILESINLAGNEQVRFPWDYAKYLVLYMEQYPDFAKQVAENMVDPTDKLDLIIETAIRGRCEGVAELLFRCGLERSKAFNSTVVCKFVDGVMAECQSRHDRRTMSVFRERLFPMVKEIDDAEVRDRIAEWEQTIESSIQAAKEDTFRQPFRSADGSFTPDRASEQLRIHVPLAARDSFEPKEVGRRAYTYCGVIFGSSSAVYHYRTQDETIEVGDTVLVPTGADCAEAEATVVSVGRYDEGFLPYPLQRTKLILRKISSAPRETASESPESD